MYTPLKVYRWRWCPGEARALRWVEAWCALVLAANVLQHAVRLARLPRATPLPPSPLAARVRGGGEGAPVSAISEQSDSTASLSPPRVWRVADSSPPPSPPSPRGSPRGERACAADEFISDARALRHYLRRCAPSDLAEVTRGADVRPSPPPLLQHYQLASLDDESSAHEETGVGGAGGASRSPPTWRRLLLEPQRLTEWNLNLRLWLHVTILERLVREMERIDGALAALGLGDVRLGHAPLERLQKLPGAAALSSLGALLPYLEPFADQRYAVQRIRELARGGCLSAYRWNGGGSEWDDGKPTDAELLLQLLAAYLDGQLPPVPGARPFSAAHLSAAPAPPARGPGALVIHRARARPPHYVLVRGDAVVEVARGRNNLLHTVLLFIAVAARSDPPALQRLHLGPAGLNMLWIIGR